MITSARKKLLSSIGYHSEGIRLELFRKIDAYLTENKLTRKALAEKLDVSKGYISQVLNGESDVRISKLVQLSLAVGLVPIISWIPTEKYLASGGKVYSAMPKTESVNYTQPKTASAMMARAEGAIGVDYVDSNFKKFLYPNRQTYTFKTTQS
ncbi:MAG: helix-turn-helix domain-containing protein [Saprospiraceae bacterium]